MADTQEFTVGIEEEYQIVDPVTRQLSPKAVSVLRNAQKALGEEVHHELHLSQIETASSVCRTLAEVRAEVVESRHALVTAARHVGGRIAAAGTHPLSHYDDQPITPKARYRGLHMDYQHLARELVIFGCHVHVGLADRELAVQVLNRARVWLSPLLALAANSPFWLGEDTGYASFRAQLWGQWPTSGAPHLFKDYAEYEALLQALVAADAIDDTSNIYWDIRLPQKQPTVEFRVTDVCLSVDEAVMIAGLARGIVRTCCERALRDEPYCKARPELIRAAHFRAARYGLDRDLVDVRAERAVPAAELMETFLEFVRPGLEAEGDWDEVSSLVRETLRRGNGAQRQREIYRSAGRIEDVVDYIISETSRGAVPAKV